MSLESFSSSQGWELQQNSADQDRLGMRNAHFYYEQLHSSEFLEGCGARLAFIHCSGKAWCHQHPKERVLGAVWGIHQAATPAKAGSRLSRELKAQGLLIPTAGAPRGGVQPVRGGRGHAGVLLSSFAHCPPSPTPNLQRNRSRVASPLQRGRAQPGTCSPITGPSGIKILPSAKGRRRFISGWSFLWVGISLWFLARRNTEHSA